MEVVFSHFPAFLLVLVRVTSFFVTVPLFSYRTIPNIHRIGLSFLLSWLMFLSLKKPTIEIDSTYFLLILKEALIGLCIGFIAYMVISAIQVAGGFIDFQMGFAIANIIDPQTGAQSPIVGQYLYTFALLFMLSVNGHHLLLDGIYYSYRFIPLDQIWIPFGHANLIEFVVKSFSTMFMIAFQMAVPIVGSLFLVDVALGIVARTVPQFNIFVVGFPIKIGVSFIVFIIVMSGLFMLIQQLFENMLYTMRGLMELFGGA
jgi:flagellar biosynthesis protein FliR